ncbi:hypothetical protein HDV01_006522 [Terramyces sp. JEL0728]|nr:hypothetical protein HDV01_006522 [Terramyces sp. JEL0728]
MLPKRPGFGSSGRPIKVAVNIFPVQQIASKNAFQYDISITPELPQEKQRRVFAQLEQLLAQKYKGCWIVYDGKKNAFSTFDLKYAQTFEIVIPEIVDYELPQIEQRGSTGGRGASNTASRPSTIEMKLVPAKILTKDTIVGKSLAVKLTIKKTATINLHELLMFAQGKGLATENVLHCENALSVVLRHIPSMLFTPVGSNFFTPVDRVPIAGGLEVWRGYHQSIRAMVAGHLGINVDVASTVFRKGNISVLDYLCEIYNVEFNKVQRLSIAQIEKGLKGVNCITTHRGEMKQRFNIKKISKDSAASMMFEKDGKTVSVKQYFESEFNIRLKFPNMPLALKANGKTAFPLECLSIQPAQRFKDRLSGNQTANMIRATCQKPQDRKRQIENAVAQSLKYGDNAYMKAFGIKVDGKMMEIEARVLPAPDVVFKNNKSNGAEGAWNMNKAKLVSAPLMDSFAFIFFTDIKQNVAYQIKDVILKKWSTAGMNIPNSNCPVLVQNPDIPGNIKKSMMTAFNEAGSKMKAKCKIIVCIINKESKGVYEQIKTIALCEGGIMTQCMQSKHVRSPDEIKDQYIINVALKANIKLGGATNHVDRLPLTEVATMFMGADVTHPAPSSCAPSIAAVVATTDKNATNYNTYCRAQDARVEMITELHDITMQALADFQNKNKMLPKRIVFFRDGVSNGQFKVVLETEVKAVKTAMEKMKITGNLTFVVVQKRHHIRLFPIDQNKDHSGNCLPGTVIDKTITHPAEYNFILQSHAGIQGMSRPTIYHVLYDEQKMKPDELQQLCFNLCYLAERATRSISMVAPAYRAHLAAYFARMFIAGDDTSISSGESNVTLRAFARGIENRMYYM